MINVMQRKCDGVVCGCSDDEQNEGNKEHTEFAQQSQEWFGFRRKFALTASRFGDAVGVGTGHPLDFLGYLHAMEAEIDEEESPPRIETAHGIEYEPIIRNMYILLSGNNVKECGLFTLPDSHPMSSLIAATPDGKIIQPEGGVGGYERVLGLLEIKAPVYKMYTRKQHPLGGIPKRYICQMMGQMGVSGVKTWCDFMAVCMKTKTIVVKRLYFSEPFWLSLKSALLRFILALKFEIGTKQLARLPHGDWDLPERHLVIEDRCVFNMNTNEFVGDNNVGWTWDSILVTASKQANM
eukprot:m.242139 g.242139  ORF g.242139 m.242139 type:complete len:295 (-) comp30209_c0_seq1:256-1140(-)